MTDIAPHISDYLRERLPLHRGASSNTCDSYAYAFQLLFDYTAKKYRVLPCQLSLEQIDASLVLGFLKHLETDRKNSPRTRNARLVAIKSFMKFVQYRVPSILDQVQSILAIPAKKTDHRLIHFLTIEEVEAIMNQPDGSTRNGIRDRAMIHTCFSAGLRVSELVNLKCDSIDLRSPSLHIIGKGRKERMLPIWPQTAELIKTWLNVRGKSDTSYLFINTRNQPISRSGFEYILKKHSVSARSECTSLEGKTISPHVLRHTSAMLVLQATGDIRKVSLWLGHANIQTTEAYLRANPMEKLDIVASLMPPTLIPGKFSVPDKLMALFHK